MKKFLSTVTFFSLLIVGSALTMTSCKDDDGPAIAEITVFDTTGLVQTNVRVDVFCTQPNCVVTSTGRTDSRGESRHEFDLPAVLRVYAVRYDSTFIQTGVPPNVTIQVLVDSVCGDGFVTVDNGETVQESVTLFPCIQ